MVQGASVDTGSPESEPGRGGPGGSSRGGRARYGYLLALCAELDEPVTVDRLVDPMYEWERDLTSGPSEKSWFDVHEELFLVDLPVLDRAGFLEFDRDRGLVVDAEER